MKLTIQDHQILEDWIKEVGLVHAHIRLSKLIADGSITEKQFLAWRVVDQLLESKRNCEQNKYKYKRY